MESNYGRLVDQGKTKILYDLHDEPGMFVLCAKDDITAYNGERHDVIPGKAELANRTTCNVFEMLRKWGVPVAYDRKYDDVSFVAPECRMIPVEVVIRGEAHGSYLRRYPDLHKGHSFDPTVCEFFLKTHRGRFGAIDVASDDPLMIVRPDGSVRLYKAYDTFAEERWFHIVKAEEVFLTSDHASRARKMHEVADLTFRLLRDEWGRFGYRLVDFKVEFGIDSRGELLLADVIDNDSWRLMVDEVYLDKQRYRDGKPLDDVIANYRRVADLTGLFGK